MLVPPSYKHVKFGTRGDCVASLSGLRVFLDVSPRAVVTISNVEICSGQMIFHVLGNGWCSVNHISAFF